MTNTYYFNMQAWFVVQINWTSEIAFLLATSNGLCGSRVDIA